LPRKLKIDGNNRKYILKELLYRHVPREMVDRPKMGFSVPIGRWLKGDLREWAEGLLDPVSLKSSHYLDHEKVNKLWAEHLKGDSKFDQQLWSILVFQAWLKDLDNFR